MPIQSRLTMAVALAIATFTAMAAQADSTVRSQSGLIAQAQGLPKDFQEHFFDVPLAVRILLNGQVLGEAMVVLSREEQVTLLDFTDTHESVIGHEERDHWQSLLRQGVALGPCTSRCDRLIAAHYNLQNSELELLSTDAERPALSTTHHRLPEQGSSGLIVQNQLNLSGRRRDDLSGRYGLEAIGSLGNWTHTFHGELTRMGGEDNLMRHSVHELHAQREWEDNFFRIGLFTPHTIGLSRAPRSFGTSPDTALGIMLGSSDGLAKDGAKAAVYPVYVTANRDATVEIYRNGSLINSQMVKPGLQVLDTRPLPSGIYDIEVRLIEDGLVTSTTEELVYKPTNWRNPEQRWRYNVFAGRESQLLSNWEEVPEHGNTAGVAVNYLAHPRAVVGLSARQVRGQNQLGTSLDLGLGARSSLFGTVYRAQERGMGLDLQAMHDYGSGNINLSHSRSWLDTRDTYETLINGDRVRQRNPYSGQVSNSSLGVTHRLGGNDSVQARLSHSEGQVEGVGLDLGYMRTTRWLGHDSNWRVSVFDRPAAISSGLERNRGFDLTLSLALGKPGQRFTASAGSRASRSGETDRNASLGYQRDIDAGPVRSVRVGLQSDTYGVGMTGSASVDSPLAVGDVYLQRSSYNHDLSASVNLTNHMVIGGGTVAMSSQYVGKEAGMIVDVESDIEHIELRADDLSGSGAVLRPGRNVVPVSAYRQGTVQFDFQGTDAPSANIEPARSAYHLNKGGVAYQKVRVMKTLTVLGRLVDAEGLPLKGHHVINHASRGVTEVDGFFSMELSASTPTLEVVQGDRVMCQFTLDPSALPSEDRILMAGDLRCLEGTQPETLAAR